MADIRRVAGWAGIAFVVLSIVQFAVAPAPPGADAASAKIRDYLVDNRSGILAQSLVLAVAFLFFVVFVGGVSVVLRATEDGRMLAVVAAAAAAVLVATVLVAQAVLEAPVWIESGGASMSDDVIRLSWSLANLAFGMAGPMAALLAGAVAIAGFRSGVVPRWASAVAAIAAVVGVAGALELVSPALNWLALLSFLAVLAFALATSVALLRDRAALAS